MQICFVFAEALNYTVWHPTVTTCHTSEETKNSSSRPGFKKIISVTPNYFNSQRWKWLILRWTRRDISVLATHMTNSSFHTKISIWQCRSIHHYTMYNLCFIHIHPYTPVMPLLPIHAALSICQPITFKCHCLHALMKYGVG